LEKALRRQLLEEQIVEVAPDSGEAVFTFDGRV
jgi:hypothetical protein